MTQLLQKNILLREGKGKQTVYRISRKFGH